MGCDSGVDHRPTGGSTGAIAGLILGVAPTAARTPQIPVLPTYRARSPMRQPRPTEPKHLTASQAAALLQVSPKTVSRWAKEGKLPYVRTLGGHRRYPDSEIRALVETLSRAPDLNGPDARSA
jgi:excisionase family DNA binding protein